MRVCAQLVNDRMRLEKVRKLYGEHNKWRTRVRARV